MQSAAFGDSLSWFKYINKTYDASSQSLIDATNPNCASKNVDVPCEKLKAGRQGTCKLHYLSCNQAGLKTILKTLREDKSRIKQELADYEPCKLFTVEARALTQMLMPYFTMYEKFQLDRSKLTFYQSLTKSWTDELSQKAIKVKQELSLLTSAEAYSRIRQLLSELSLMNYNDALGVAKRAFLASLENYFYPLLALREKERAISAKIIQLNLLMQQAHINKCFSLSDIDAFKYSLTSTLENKSFSTQLAALVASYDNIRNHLRSLVSHRREALETIERFGKNLLGEVIYNLNVQSAQGIVNDYYVSLNDPIVYAETEFAVRKGQHRITQLLTDYRSPLSARIEAEAMMQLIEEMAQNLERVPCSSSMKGYVKAIIDGARETCRNSIILAKTYCEVKKDLVLKAREMKISAWKHALEQKPLVEPADCHRLAENSLEHTIISERNYQKFLDLCEKRP
jgi:hypothetical protein